MATLLVVGGTGLLGAKVAAEGGKRYDVVATRRSLVPSVEDVRFVEMHKERPDEAAALLQDVGPDFVVDTAAFHNVDKCEEDRALAWRVNVAGTKALAEAAEEAGARYLYVSTDFVFGGAAEAYRESDEPKPVNYYGEVKLAAERAVLGVDPANQIVRPSVVFGWNDTRLNFATWILTSLREGKEVRIVTDWYGSPTLADSLADGILRLLESQEGGVFHLAGPDCLSRYDFAVKLANAFDLDASLIRPVKAAKLNLRAARPPHSCLVNERAASLGITILGVDDALALMRSQRSLETFVPPQQFKS
jgi:dTDP-4-dehydrorhamnose reductase